MLVMMVKPRCEAPKRRNCHAARCLAGSFVKTYSPLPELTGWTDLLPNDGSPAVRSSNFPFAAASAPYSNAVLFRNIARLPLLKAAIASLELSGGWVPSATRRWSHLKVSMAGGWLNVAVRPSVDRSVPPLLLTSDWAIQS